MDTGKRAARWSPVSWLVASLVVGVGGVWLTAVLQAQGPGDSGPVVGNSVMDHLQVGLLYGAGIVLLAAGAGWLVALVVHRDPPHDRDGSAGDAAEQ